MNAPSRHDRLAALAAEIRPILEANPNLGNDGFRCPHTDGDYLFQHQREAALWVHFTVEVMENLELLADRHRPGLIRHFKTGREFAKFCTPPYYHDDGTPTAEAGTVRSLGAVIVACIVAGVPFRRIPGSPDIEISAKGGRVC